MVDTYTSRAVEGYIACALWAGLDYRDGDYPDPLDSNYGASDVSPSALESILVEVSDFVSANRADLEGWDPEQAGHDFYLTRNRHGAGFWDRGRGDAGDRLTEAAHVYGSSEFYVGDDDALYVG